MRHELTYPGDPVQKKLERIHFAVLLLILAAIVAVLAWGPRKEPPEVTQARAAVRQLQEQDARDDAASAALGRRVATDPAPLP